MTSKELSLLREKVFAEVAKVMESKGKEYSGNNDRLANFKRNGENLRLRAETVWSVYCAKHWDSVMSFVSSLEHGKDIQELEKDLAEPIDGRILDIITYMILLQGLIQEGRRVSQRKKITKKGKKSQ